MSFEATVFEPKGDYEPRDVVGLYPLPFDANLQNSGDRLQTLTDNVGFPIIASDLMLQSKRVIFDMKARQANQPSGDVYRNMSRRRADFYQSYAEQFSGATRIGIGDSLCVPVVQGMQLHGEERPFDAVLLRDGWNLDPRGDRIVGGIARYIGYTLRDQLHQMKRASEFDITDYGWTRAKPEPQETNLREKLVNVADLMRGPENRANAVLLAQQAVTGNFALKLTLFKNGLSGTEAQCTAFQEDIETAQSKAMRRMVFGQKIGRVRTDIVPGWHSDILDPTRAAADIDATLALIRPAR